jgi:hypothetical protein
MKLRHIGLLLLVFAGGCKKMSAPMTEAPPEAYWGAEQDAAAGGAMPTAVEESEPDQPMDMDSPPPEPERKGGRWSRRDRAARTEVATPAPGPQSTPIAGEKAEPAIEKPPQDDLDSRHIIYSAQMTVSVFNLADAMEKAEALPETFGGYIQSMSEGNLVLRIPSQGLRKAMDELADFGVVDHRSLQAADVTAEFTDIDSRIRALSETQKQLLELLTKARTVKEALEVRQALDGINTELEVLKGRMRQLENQIGYSTLTVSLYERGPHMPTPSSNDPFLWVNDLGVESTEWK